MTLRYYQANATDAGCELLKGSTSITNGVVVIPTGGGKSHVIGAIADDMDDAGLILQPSKEILEQNYQKLIKLGRNDVSIYSASLGIKKIDKITLATIGSIYRTPELFKHFKYISMDECDLANANEGMYKEFFEEVKRPVLGLTASPWRVEPGRKIGQIRVRGGRMIDKYSGSVNRIITRTKPRIFEDLIHITQIKELYDHGYLCPIEYNEGTIPDQLKLTLNSSGVDYTEATYKRISNNVIWDAYNAVRKSTQKHHLIFTKRIDEADEIAKMLNNMDLSCEVVTGTTKKDEREAIIARLKSGKTKCVANVGVLAVGFDFPKLDHIVLARPTNSLRLYYQMVGRGIRPHDSKNKCILSDLCGNVDRFGDLQDWVIKDENGNKKYRLYKEEKPLTGVDLKYGKDMETEKPAHKFTSETEIHFGKYKGKKFGEAPENWLNWVVENFSNGDFKNAAKDELQRRKLKGIAS